MTDLVDARCDNRSADPPWRLGLAQTCIFLATAHSVSVRATDHDQVFSKTARRIYRPGQ
jgi:hypothetical protein